MEQKWHTKTINELFDIFQTRESGLSTEEALKKIEEIGKNRLPETKTESLFNIFFQQFQSPLIYILLSASILVFILGDFIDGLIILIVLLINAIVGTIQEGKAQNTLLALKKFTETNATVIRDNKEVIIPDSEVVPGDILVLIEGNKIPADSRIIISNGLRINESSLTGESEPVNKTTETVSKNNAPITDQKNMVFRSTNIVAGNGKAIVVSTGLNTVIGKIAKEIIKIDTEIPLKKNIRHLSHLIVLVVSLVSVILFSIGILSGKSLKEMFTVVVSLSVSVIPEGLPIVVTLILANGVWKMSKSNVLIKKIQAVESLGQASVIAVDKTGTITKNELVIQQIYLNGDLFNISGINYEPKGDVYLKGKVIDPLNHPDLLFAAKIAALSTNAHASYDLSKERWYTFGDPTDVALSVFSEKIGFRKDVLEQELIQINEIPFDYKNKYHATAHVLDDKTLISIVGAPEVLLKLISKKYINNSNINISATEISDLKNAYIKMSQNGLRVLALATKIKNSKSISEEDINDLTFIGFVGMKDNLKKDVKEIIQKIKSSGIKVVMITGDHKLTGQSIATEANIYNKGDEIITGQEMDLLSDIQLKKKINNISVFARVTPEHKLRIINAYRENGEIIAMTGDGVNDAPSLVAADLGIAMGKIGTEVAKEASDIILLDDNFSNIISAIEEGRNIYKTIKKVILYLFSTSIGEVLVIAGALILRYPLPVLATHIIWLNFVTDPFLGTALAMEPREDNLLYNNFEKPKKYILDNIMVQRMLFMSIIMMFGSLVIFRNYFSLDIVKAWTMSLTTMAVFQWFNAWNCRHESRSIFSYNFLSNLHLIISTIIIIILHMLVVYNPFLQKIMKTTSLSISEWGIIILIGSSIVIIEEIRKIIDKIPSIKSKKIKYIN